MSEFDKEAERQRLREKYEEEREDREATQRMSELLLKGATMTNKHCGNCGDPIFRYDGQEFCPSCSASQQASVDAANADADATSTNANADADAASTNANADADAANTNADGEPVAAEAEPTGPVDDHEPEPAVADGATDPSGDVTSEPTPTGSNREPGVAHADDDLDAATSTDPDRDTTDLDRDAPATDPVNVDGSAVGNVEATLERFAAAAADTDDPARAREYLAVVRDATDTLRTLRARQ